MNPKQRPRNRGNNNNNGGGNGGGGGGGRPSGGGGGGGRHINVRSQVFDSNGPEGRIRGNAHQVMEKYLTLARDASSQGDRIAAENYYQHAEHYFRMINAANQNGAQRRPQGPSTPAEDQQPETGENDEDGNRAADDGAEGQDGDNGDNGDNGSEADADSDAPEQANA